MYNTIFSFIIVLTICPFVSSNAFSQNLTNDDLLQLESLEIEISNFDFNDAQIREDLISIISLNKAEKRTKKAGFMFASLGVIGIIYGSTIINSNEGDGLGESIGTMTMVGGSVFIGASIPLFLSSRKKKRNLDRLIENYR